MVNVPFLKGVSTVFSAVLLNLILGIIYSFPSLSQYYSSYLFYHGISDITLTKCLFLMPISSFFINASAPFGGVVENKYGIRLTSGLGVALMLISFLIVYFITNIYITYLSMAILGVGIGMSYVSVLRASWRHFPHKKGLLSGLILTGYGLSASLFNFISEEMINPRSLKPAKGQFYSKEIADKIKDYFFIVVIMVLTIGFTSVCLLFDFKEENEGENRKKLEFLMSTGSDMSIHELNGENNVSSLYFKNEKEPLRRAFTSKRFYIICFMAFCYVFYPFMILNLAKPFANFSLEPEFVKIIMICYPLVNGFSRLLMGIMVDYISFKKLYISLIVTGIGVSCSIGYISHINWVYFIYCMISASLLGGNFSLLPPLMSQIYGIKNSAELLGIVCFACGISCLSGPFITQFLIRETVKDDYLIVFWIGTFLQIIALILCLILKEKKFNYNKPVKIVDEREVEKIINR